MKIMSTAVVERISLPSNPTPTTMIEIESEKTIETKIIKYNPEMENIEDEEINIIEITPKILLPKALHNLMQRIFDPNALTAALKGMKLDLQKLSVGELTQDQISAARRILKELAQELRTGLSLEHVQKASEEFYSLIPHANRRNIKFPLLDNPNIIDSKASMLNTLADIEIANRSIGDLILQTDLTRQDVIERYYERLNCEITVLNHESETFKLIEQYAQTNHRVSEDFKLDIIDIFEINRPEEAARFNKGIGNVQLLWHGSRTVNFVGILSHGLQVPEKPRDLWFGKGVYFADTVCLSASYCDEEDSMLLLCEVALGNIDRKSNLDFELIQPDETKHSVKGLGKWYPDRKENCTIDGNVRVPIGQLIKREDKDDLILDYNEYIVYNITQIRIRYLVQVNIGMKGITRQNGLVANPEAV